MAIRNAGTELKPTRYSLFFRENSKAIQIKAQDAPLCLMVRAGSKILLWVEVALRGQQQKFPSFIEVPRSI